MLQKWTLLEKEKKLCLLEKITYRNGNLLITIKLIKMKMERVLYGWCGVWSL